MIIIIIINIFVAYSTLYVKKAIEGFIFCLSFTFAFANDHTTIAHISIVQYL